MLPKGENILILLFPPKGEPTCDQVTLAWYIQGWRAVLERVLRQR